jgi:methyl-accepting chemotaxis protein
MSMSKTEGRPHHKRRLRNFLLDVGLQLRYTVFIIAVGVFMAANQGGGIYVATQETTRIVTMTASVDPGTEHELQQQFQAKDRVVLWAIAGFGLVLVLSITAAGIWMTHKVVGPLHNIGAVLARIRDNRIPEDLGHLRRGDELQAFHKTFREMYDAIRARALRDKDALEKAIAAVEAQPARSPDLERALEELRRLLADKTQSLEPRAD